MISIGLRVAATVAIVLFGSPAWSQSETSGLDRLYILDCGQGHASDQSRWSPGVNVGVPLDIVDNCYLIHHAQGYLLWDTGISDQVAALPGGEIGTGTALVWRKRSRGLSKSQANAGLKAYCRRGVYRGCLVAGAERIDLDGNAAGVVTDAEAAQAAVTPKRTAAAPEKPPHK